jgi:hypothetical protein
MTSLKNVSAVGLFCAGLTAGCGGADRDERNLDPSGNDVDITASAPIIETGCLTASGDRFVLTALETTEDTGVPQTELYQLIGESDELRAHVGRAVRVSGEAEPARVAELREISPSVPAGTGGAADDNQQEARVQTESQTRIETRQLRVQSVTPTGDDCEARTR